MQPPDGGLFGLTGEFRDVDPPARLSYTFVWEDPDPDDAETLVVLSFRDLGGSTEVSLSQGPLKTEPRHALHRRPASVGCRATPYVLCDLRRSS